MTKNPTPSSAGSEELSEEIARILLEQMRDGARYSEAFIKVANRLMRDGKPSGKFYKPIEDSVIARTKEIVHLITAQNNAKYEAVMGAISALAKAGIIDMDGIRHDAIDCAELRQSIAKIFGRKQV